MDRQITYRDDGDGRQDPDWRNEALNLVLEGESPFRYICYALRGDGRTDKLREKR